MCLDLSIGAVVRCLFGKINASPLMLSCPPHVQRMEGEEEDTGGGKGGGWEAHIKWMQCKWHQRTPESIYLIETNESGAALPRRASPSLSLAALVVIVINPSCPNA